MAGFLSDVVSALLASVLFDFYVRWRTKRRNKTKRRKKGGNTKRKP